MEKIEVYPFIRHDIRDIVMSIPTNRNGSVDEWDANKTANEIMDKVTEFVNENYLPRA